MVKAIILDFDGTFTDVEVEAREFVGDYRRAVADLLGREVEAAWRDKEAQVAARPGEFGWRQSGVIVAPANADPYVRSTCVAQLLFDDAGLLRDLALRDAITSAIYQHAYKHTANAFRPDAARTLEALLATGKPIFVVTNSRPDSVAGKLAKLGDGLLARVRVFGDARKFVVCEASAADPRFGAVPRERQVVGLARPMYPRRGRYFDVLAQIWAEVGCGPDETLVCGDIFELDLALPVELGMQVHLLTGAHTPPYELDILRGLGARAGFGAELGALIGRV